MSGRPRFSDGVTRWTDPDTPTADAPTDTDLREQMRSALEPVVEYRRHHGLDSEDADAYAITLLPLVRAQVEAARLSGAVEAVKEAADLIEPFSGIGLANGATRADVAAWLRDRAALDETRRP